MNSEHSEPVPLDGPLLELWQKAQDDFYVSTGASEERRSTVESPPNPQKWLAAFQKARHPKSKWGKVYQAVCGHIENVQLAIGAMDYIIGIAAVATPVIAPASLVVNALAWVFESFAKVSDKFDKIEEFFKLLANKFDNLSILREVLQEEKRGVMRRRVIELFACSLRMCAIAIRDPKHRFKTWVATLIGESDADEELAEFRRIEHDLLESINMWTLAEVTGIRKGLQRSSTISSKWQELLVWLSRVDFLGKYNELIDRVHERPRAGRWLLESEPFVKWRDQDEDRLWYTGKPGAGKSVLATIIIRHLQELIGRNDEHSTRPSVAYLYLSNEVDLDLNLLLGTIARQVLATYSDQSALPSAVSTIFRKYLKNGEFGPSGTLSPPSKGELENILCVVAAERPLYLVIDAMDECRDKTRKELMQSLRKIKSGLKIIVTARLLEGRKDLAQGFQLHTIEADGGDINDYIDSFLENNSLLKRNEARVKQEVRNRSNGIFLLTRLHMDALEEVEIEANIETALQDLPMDPEECYSKAVERMQRKTGERRKYAFDVLAWVSYAMEPLSLDELRHALAFSNVLDENEITESSLLPVTEISAYCCGLVVTDVNQKARFVHYSAKTFFQSHKEVLFGSFHLVATFTCAKYLCSVPLDGYAKCKTIGPGVLNRYRSYPANSDFYSSSEDEEEKDTIDELLERYPFAKYAGRWLGDHYRPIRNQAKDLTRLSSSLDGSANRRSQDSHTEIQHSEVLELMHSLIEVKDRKQFYLDVLGRQKSYYTPDRNLDPNEGMVWYWDEYDSRLVWATSLHIAVFLGSLTLVERQLSKNPDLDAMDSHDQSSLVIAFKHNFDDIVGLLLSRGASVDLSVRRGHALLLYAAYINYDQAARAIISRAAGSEPDWTFEVLLMGLLSPVVILLYLVGILTGKPDLVFLPRQFTEWLGPRDRAKTENAKKEDRQDIDSEEEEVTKDNSARHLQFKQYYKLLLAAYDGDIGALARYIATTKIDIKPAEEAQPKTRQRSNRRLSDFSHDFEHFEIQERSHSGHDDESLEDSVETRSYSERPSRPATPSRPETPPSARSERTSLDRESEEDTAMTPNFEYRRRPSVDSNISSLTFTSYSRSSFIDGGSTQNREGFLTTACILAVERNHLQAVELLLANGVDINQADHGGQTLLHRATCRNNIEMVKFLLRKKADVQMKDQLQRTALMAYANMSHEEVLELLLQKGANILETGHRDVHEIYRAAAHGKIDVVRFFLKHKVPASIYGESGWTALHAAAANGHLECVKLLLKFGARPSPISDTGKTPLDFVRNNEKLYDLPLLQESHSECEAYRKKHENYPDIEARYEQIESRLLAAGAKTSQELYAELGEEEFYYGPGGQYTHAYYADEYQEKIDALAAAKKEKEGEESEESGVVKDRRRKTSSRTRN